MPKYMIYRSYGYAGTESADEIEAESLDEATEEARDFAYELVEFWAEEIEAAAVEPSA